MNRLQFRSLVLLCLLALTACGFHMRGAADLSFHTIYIQNGAPGIMPDLKQIMRSNDVKLLPSPDQAEMLLDLMKETTDKRILSLSGGGKVKEYALTYRVTFRAKEAGSELWGAAQTVEEQRTFSYDDSQLLAKDYEEARILSDMRAEAARKIMRRLSAQQTRKPSAAN
ncbi:MAG TPA: LPS assembly lipoprotein LptE [Methylophilaceae bacterium]|nr:LPS assembly lipoprotein LptE [Methylophilaceae bacterium]